MGPKGWRVCLALLLAACIATLPGCFGGTSNPSYFPYLLPTGDIIQTHAKPIGPGYLANFDPYAIDLVVRPIDQTNPVRTQFAIVATVRDDKGRPLRGRRIEWMLEGVGHIVEVDEHGCSDGRGYKVSDRYGVSYTDYFEHTITRGNKNPNDDFTIRPGQTWCVVTSPIEGDTHVTVYAPGVYDWDKGRVFVTCKWVDANWIFPPGAIVAAGTPQVLTTRVLRHTDKQPLANYRVRYSILDDNPPTVFSHTRTKEATAVSDLNGNASVTVLETIPQPGLTHVAVEIIRPPDPTSPSGSGVTVARGDTTIEWLAPSVALNVVGPPTGAVGNELTYTTTVTNGGKIESRSMTVTQPIPDGVQYLRSQPNAIVDNKQLIWTLGRLPPGQTHTVQAVYSAIGPGSVNCCSSLATEEGVRDTKCAKTDIGQAQLRVIMTGPAVGQINVPFSYQINVINEGASPATNVRLEAIFDQPLKHKDGTRIELKIGTLKPQENRPVPLLTLTPTDYGRFSTVVTVTADGGLTDKAQQSITVAQGQLGVKLIGQSRKYLGWDADWEIRVSNESDTAVAGVQVKNLLPPELIAQSWSDNGKAGAGEVAWDVGDLKPHEARTVTVKTRADKLAKGAVNQVVATAAAGLVARDQVNVDVFALPGLHFEVSDKNDPVQVGKTVTYFITVTNTGAAPATKIDITAMLPNELQVVENGARGPTATSVKDQVVTFATIDSLAPRQKLEYQIEARALRPGDVRFRAEMRSPALTSGQPVVEEQATRIVEAGPGG